MALSWTLVRTYTPEYPTQPELVLGAVNRRILADTRTDQFVTVFYGILDPATGTLVYSNAGHCPPYLISAQQGKAIQKLIRTGIPLGILEDRTWEQKTVQIVPGDVLLLYTDGITEARNEQGMFYGADRLLESARINLGCPAQEIRDAIMADVSEFVGDAPQSDDIALAVVVRDSTDSSQGERS